MGVSSAASVGSRDYGINTAAYIRGFTSHVRYASVETWISAGDRRPDHVLTYLQGQDGTLQLAFIDYAYSMSQVWAAADAPSGIVATYLPVQPHVDSLRAMTGRILQLDDERVKTIVTRIGGEYLPTPKKDVILANLLSRKAKLYTLLGLN